MEFGKDLVMGNARETERQCDFEENKVESFTQLDKLEKNDRDTSKNKQLAFAVFAALTPHRQPHAQKWALPFFGYAHPPPYGW